jgi:hypothetical protein
VNDARERSSEDGVLTVFYWNEEPDREAEGLWWCDDLELPDEEP